MYHTTPLHLTMNKLEKFTGLIEKKNIFVESIRNMACHKIFSSFYIGRGSVCALQAWSFFVSYVTKYYYEIQTDMQVKSMERSGTEAFRTQIQPTIPKREIPKITNSQTTKRTYGQPIEQLFPKRWPLSSPNRTKNNMNTRKVKHHLNFDTKNRQ